MSWLSRLMYVCLVALTVWGYRCSSLPGWWSREMTVAYLFAVPGVLCWWPALAHLRAYPCRWRSVWLWVLLMGPPCLLLGGCYAVAFATMDAGLEQLRVWMGGIRLVWLVFVPYLVVGGVLKWAFVPAAGRSGGQGR